MRSLIGKCVMVTLAVSLIVGPYGAYADETEPVVVTPKTSQPLPTELKWRQDLENAKKTKKGLMVSGSIIGVVGVGTMVAGNLKTMSAQNVDGCEADGLFNVVCDDQKSLDEAQDKIDSGKQIMIVGLVVALVGGGLLWGGSQKSSEIDDLERQGRKNGYKLSMDQTKGGRVRLLMVKSF
ncbi:MAG: hypothetical protein IPN90_07250 [Elusimicrobia bacterium]|nr:hypothetical protein [Elusimicrobiota bacterium]